MAAIMRAVQWTSSSGGIEKHIRVNNVSIPNDAAKDSTLIKVEHTKLNPMDYKIAETPFIHRLITRTPGSDFAGNVVSSSHSDLKQGDAVLGVIDPPSFGAFAEYVQVKGRQNVAHLPDGGIPRDAAALGVVALTAYQSIVPFVSAGDKVFINGGSGGVGTFGIQIAKVVGCHVTTTCSSPNMELCKSLGADDIINYRNTNVVEHLKRQGTQYALLFDAVGIPDIYYSAHHYLKPTGLFTTIAVDPTSLTSVWRTFLMFALSKVFGGGQCPLRVVSAKADLVIFDQLAQWLKEGEIKTHIDQEY